MHQQAGGGRVVTIRPFGPPCICLSLLRSFNFLVSVKRPQTAPTLLFDCVGDRKDSESETVINRSPRRKKVNRVGRETEMGLLVGLPPHVFRRGLRSGS